MALKLPGGLNALASGNSPLDVLEYELLAEKASALGRAGEKVEKALAGLKLHEPGSADRHPALKQAAEAVYAYFIQRELCGFRRHAEVIREYQIPGEVLARLGAR